MRAFPKYIGPIIFSILYFSPVLVQGQQLHFQHISSVDGLPQKRILCLLEDRIGFLWVGTEDGLYRYDGRQFREFRSYPADTSTLSHNYILSMAEGGDGRIWVGTRTGLCSYSPQTESFTRYYYDRDDVSVAKNLVHSVKVDRKGFVWYGTYKGLYRLDPASQDMLRFLPDPENANSIQDEVVWNIFEDSKGRMWFGTREGIAIYKNDGSFKFQRYKPEPNSPGGLKIGRVWEFLEQPDGTIWLGTKDGIYRVFQDGVDMKFERLGNIPGDPNSLSYNFVQTILAEGNNRIWVGTWTGGLDELVFKNPEKTEIEFIHHQHEEGNPNSLNNNIVEIVLRDKSGSLWVGTEAGLNKASPLARKFNVTGHLEQNPASLSNSDVTAILQDNRGNVWMGTNGGGLNVISQDDLAFGKQNFTTFRSSTKGGLPHDNIYGLYQDSKGFLWVSTYRGLAFADISKGVDKLEFSSLSMEDGLPNNFIFNVLEVEDEVYWVATYGKLARMYFKPGNPSVKARFEWFDMDPAKPDALTNAMTYMLCQDRFGQVWIGTYDGLSQYAEEHGREFFINYKNMGADNASLSENLVNVLHLDSKGRLWAGTMRGLNYFKQNKAGEHAQVITFGVQNGFPNDFIHSIEEDGQGRLWLGTNGGLVVFDPDAALKGKPCVEQVYDFRDGLPDNGFNDRASCKDANGRLFFGGPGGLIFFKPKAIARNNHPPVVVFTDFKLFNESVRPSAEPKSLLKRSITLTDEIKLKHTQNVFTIEFAALDFTLPQKNQYQYKLEGINEDWVKAGNTNSATFTNLPDGSYTFLVVGSNNDRVWSTEPARLIIKVLPPPWKTWWAYLIYVVSVGSLVYAWFRHRLGLKIKELERKNAIERARFEERELLRNQNAADFHDELGHRLTKISLFLELAERQTERGSAIHSHLAKIKQHARELSGGIRDLIWTLDPQKDSLYETIVRLQEFGDSLFEHTGIQFQTSGNTAALDGFQMEPDVRRQILLIFKEAMNNCLKHSNARYSELRVSVQGGFAAFYFKDDGDGFGQNDRAHGYGLKNMSTRAKKIGAAFRIEAAQGKGTCIRVGKIPLMG
jgi:ligand-binding sensor domain-containing protein/signal transduction histidine kinase